MGLPTKRAKPLLSHKWPVGFTTAICRCLRCSHNSGLVLFELTAKVMAPSAPMMPVVIVVVHYGLSPSVSVTENLSPELLEVSPSASLSWAHKQARAGSKIV